MESTDPNSDDAPRPITTSEGNVNRKMISSAVQVATFCRRPQIWKWLFRYIVRSKITVAMVLGLMCLGVGTVVWRHRAVDYWYRTGLASISRSDLEMIQLAVQHLPADSARARLLLGAIDLRTNKPASALRKFELAAHDPETTLRAHFLAGEALCRLQDYEAAIATLQKALEQDLDNVDGHRWLAIAFFDIGASINSIDQLKEVVRLDGTDPRAYRLMGLIYFEAEEFSLAIDAYHASLNCSRSQFDTEQILAELGAALVKVHRYNNVLSLLNEAPASPELDSLRAESLYALGRGEEARTLVEQVLKTSKTSRALILQGLMLLDDGRAAEAIVPLAQFVASHPEDFETRAKLTQAYSQSGNAESARRELKEFERIKQIRQQIHELSLKAAKQPQDADIRYELGLQYLKLGLAPAGLKWIRAALALNPAHEAARKAIAELSESIPSSNRN